MGSFKPLVITLMALVLGTGCAAQRIRAEKAAAKALISDQDESKLGLQVKQELEKEGVKYVSDAVVTGYVQQITNRILPFARKDRPGVKWNVYTIDDPKTVNAFATPGGHLYVYSGLILAADNEAELAGVMAHEAGHVVGRHSARQMVNAYGLQAVTTMALGKNPRMVKQLASNLAATGVLRAHGRSEETEADDYGVRYSSAAGYDPKGLMTFFQKLGAQEGKTPALMAWMSTHPTSADRVQHIKEQIAKKRLRGGDLGAERLAPIKKRLQAGGEAR